MNNKFSKYNNFHIKRNLKLSKNGYNVLYLFGLKVKEEVQTINRNSVSFLECGKFLIQSMINRYEVY
jgi:hypothetical protein